MPDAATKQLARSHTWLAEEILCRQSFTRGQVFRRSH
jgi:hypothetical protein